MTPSEPMVVRIKDYQILKDAKFTFVNGLNVILGPSNNGKSSVIRAIEAALFHKTGESFIRLGQDAAQVGIAMNGHKINWVKTRDSGAYVLDGKEFRKIGRAAPPDIEEATGIKEITVIDSKARINFWKQMDYPFLLDKTPSQLFAFLAFSAEQDQLTSVFQRIKEDAKVIERSITSTEGKIDSTKELKKNLEEELKVLEDYEQTVKDLLSIDKQVSECDRLGQLVSEIRESMDSIKRTQSILTTLQEQLTSVGDISGIRTKIDECSALRETIKKINEKRTTIETLSTKINKMKTIEIPDLTDEIKKLKELKELIATTAETQRKIDSLESKISRVSSELEKVKGVYSILESSIKVIEDLKPKVSSFRELINKTKTTVDKVRQLQAREETLKAQLEEAEEQLSEFKVCPLCGQERGKHEH